VIPIHYIPIFASTVYNTLPMSEILRELNEHAIKDGLLLPDDQSLRKDFTPMLGKHLSWREQKAYSFIHGHSEPTTAEELAKELYPDYFKVNLGHHAIENIYSLVRLRLKKKLGETAIISRGNSGYLSRRTLIMSDVEENTKRSAPSRN
jgi:hypothetical protein